MSIIAAYLLELYLIPITSTLTGASIPTCCFSNAMGWRANFVIQIVVCVIRVAVVSYIIVFFTKVSFTENSLVPIRDMDLIAVRICQLACILLSTCSLSPFFHLSFKSPWMINLRPVDDNFRVNNNQGERNYNGHEVRRSQYTTIQHSTTRAFSPIPFKHQ